MQVFLPTHPGSREQARCAEVACMSACSEHVYICMFLRCPFGFKHCCWLRLRIGKKPLSARLVALKCASSQGSKGHV